MPPLLSRLLALDLGTKRTGAAISDELRISVRPLPIIEHTSTNGLLTQVEKIIREFNIKTVILGLPLLASGDHGTKAGETTAFGEELKKMGVEILFADERHSSQVAVELTKGASRSPKSKRSIDSVAAAVILTHYLQSLS
jgi:putative holliday junction resolvase